MVVVTATGRPAGDRADLRRRLALARLGELREGVWLRPDNLELRPDPTGHPGVSGYAATPGGDPVELAAGLWDLDAWASRATVLLAEMAARPTAGPEDLATGFVLSAAVLRHLQADPLLPDPLLPPEWPGLRLRETYEAWDARYRGVLAVWGRTPPARSGR
jgi:phenylacetic acid degradation operon negative regulatory protein